MLQLVSLPIYHDMRVSNSNSNRLGATMRLSSANSLRVDLPLLVVERHPFRGDFLALRLDTHEPKEEGVSCLNVMEFSGREIGWHVHSASPAAEEST